MYHVVDKSSGEIVEIGFEGTNLDRFDRELYDVWTGRDPVDRQAFFYALSIVVAKATVVFSADKSTIAADGADTATISIQTEGSPASVEINVGGNTVEIPLADGAGELEITSSEPAEIEIGLADNVHFIGDSLTIAAE